MTYQLPSLALGTEFDTVLPSLVLPGQVRGGSDVGLDNCEGISRSQHFVCRVRRVNHLIGLRIEPSPAPIRVWVTLAVDPMSRTRWTEHSETDLPAAEPHCRLVAVTAQGRRRVTCLLAPEVGEERVRQRVAFDLDADEIGPSGLLAIGLEDVSLPIEGALTPLADGAVGVVVVKVALAVSPPHVRPGVSTGRSQEKRDGVTAAGVRFFVVNPVSESEPVDVLLKREVSGPSQTRVEAVDQDGAVLVDSVMDVRDKGWARLHLPPSRGPVFVTARTGRKASSAERFVVRVPLGGVRP